MTIDQRNAGASKTITDTSDVTYTIDRWFAFGTAASKFSVQQDAGTVTPPAGFNDYLGVTSLTAYSVTSGDSFSLGQSIEGLNTADLGWGTANAKTVTLSFWVRSSLTGTLGGSLRNSAANRSYPFTYTISAANTWEQKSITIVGDTTGTWLTTNGIGIRVGFGLGQGSTFSGTAGAWVGSNFNNATGAPSVVGTNGATFYITGVQLEAGSTATSFEYRNYQQELAMCQRYLPAYRHNGQDILPSQIQFNSSTGSRGMVSFSVPTRVPVTGMVISAAGHFTAFGFAGGNGTGTAFTMHAGGTMGCGVDFSSSGFTTRDCATIGITNSSGFIYWTGAEL
jgi:hypothetical protein